MNELNPFSLEGKRILVTGASSGIGRQTAISCSRMGARVIFTGRDEARLEQTRAMLAGDEHQWVLAELTQQEGREAVIAALGGLACHGVVHCAGISRLSPIRMLTEAHMRELQTINVEAPMLLTQALLRGNLLESGGSMVFVASIAAQIGVAGVGFYSGTKAAIIAAARCLAMEVIKRRIRVNCLSPALVDSPLLEGAATMGRSLEQERSAYPLGFGTTEDVANAAMFLLSDASRWITGTTLVLDGGLTIN